MATLLDLGALEQFSGIFPFLLVLVLVYAILARTDFFKDKQGWAAMIATLCAIMTLFSKIAMKTISLMAPWFVLFIIFATLMILAYMALGIDQKAVTAFVSDDKFGVGTWVMAIMLIIGLGSFFSVLNEETGGLEQLADGYVSAYGTTDHKEYTSGGARDVSYRYDSQGIRVSVVEKEYDFFQTLFHPKVLGLVLVLLIAMFTVKFLGEQVK